MLQCETGVLGFYASATAAIEGYAVTPYNTLGTFLQRKQARRIIARVGQVSVTNCATFTMGFYERQYGASSTVSFSTAIGTGVHEETLTIPYEMDGTGLSVRVRHAASATAKLIGFAVEVEPRRF